MRRLLFEWCLIAALAVATIAGLLTSRAGDRIDNGVYDALIGLRAPAPSDRIVLIGIDDESLARVGRWPWPRSVHTRFLDQLARSQPAAIAYDVLFTEAGAATDDAALGRSMTTLGNVAIPALFVAPGHDGREVDVVLPVKSVAQAARTIGHVALLPDADGVARSVPLTFRANGHVWPHLMEATYRIATGHRSPASAGLPPEGRAGALIHFQPASGGFRSLSFASVLAGEVPPDFLRGRIILVGATAQGLGDRFAVPMRDGGLISGIELQANLLNALLSDRMVVRFDRIVALALSIAPTLILLLLFWRLKPWHALVAAIVLIGVCLGVSAGLLLFADIWLPPTPALSGLLLVYPLWGWRRLHAVDQAIRHELVEFATEKAPIPVATSPADVQDRIGGQTVRLRAAIAHMRDMRRLVTDTINGVNDPMLVTDLDDRIILASEAANILFSDDPCARQATPLIAAHAGLASTDAIPAELQMGGRNFTFHRLPLRDGVGKQRGWILHFSDISAIRQAQREREDMLAFLSHDMRSPQSSIITLLERYRGKALDEKVAGRIDGLARRTLSLADNFVELARFTVAPFEPQEVDLTDMIIEAADEMWPAASRRKVRITVTGRDNICPILGEREALGRALINLLDNAVKFSPEEGTVRCSIGIVDEILVECVIEDDGPGMPSDRQRALFARFGARQKVPGAGLSAGLGLAFVGVVVERHGGTIACSPRSPHGTRFALRFPLYDI